MTKYRNLKLIEVNKDTTVFIRSVGGGKYVAFGITHGRNPRMVGLTVPSTKKQLEFHFGLRW
jgi:hypothetical protein